MAKVEQRASLAKADLQDVLREMLLIRRFEEKVEERFRAGDLPGFLPVAIGHEGGAGGGCQGAGGGGGSARRWRRATSSRRPTAPTGTHSRAERLRTP